MASLLLARLTAIIMFAAIYHSAAAIQHSADEWNELVDTTSGTGCKVLPSTKCSTLDHLFGGDKKDICAELFGEAHCFWSKCQCKSGYCAVGSSCEEEGPTVYLDGWNPTKTVLKREPEGFAAEYLFSYGRLSSLLLADLALMPSLMSLLLLLLDLTDCHPSHLVL